MAEKYLSWITFTKSPVDSNINYQIKNQNLQQVKEIYFLGLTFDKQLTFKSHIQNIISRANGSRHVIHKFNNLPKPVSISTKKKIYLSLGRSILEYGSPALINLSQRNKNKLEICQNNCMRTILLRDYATRVNDLRTTLKLKTVQDRKNTLAKNWFAKASQNNKNIINHTDYKYYPLFDTHKTPHFLITNNQ